MLSNYKLHDFDFNDQNAYVYILYRKFEIVYIGMTRKLNGRLFTHLRDKKFDTARYIITTPQEAPVIEKQLIEFYKPIYNTAHKYQPGENPVVKDRRKKRADKAALTGFEATVDELAISGYTSIRLLNEAERLDVPVKKLSDAIKEKRSRSVQ